MIGRRIGRYVVEGWVGQGGMATVWKVVDDDGAPWALKVLGLQKPEVRERFRMEARVQLDLQHPHVVAARELLEVDGEPALVLQYVPGPSLDRFLLERGPPFEVRDALADQILSGVAHAHERGLVHRDLKPGNVLVDETSGAPVARITDFGLVKEQGTGATRTGIALGTPRYMAPEQIRDAKRVDLRADVWSLGALLYELYTDRAPFQRDTLYDTFSAVVDGTYADPAELVPPRVAAAIRACLHVDPGLRVQSVPALRRILRGEVDAAEVVPRSRVPTAVPAAAAPAPAPLPVRSAPPPAARTMAPPSPTLVEASWPPPEGDRSDPLPPPPPPVLRAEGPRRAAWGGWGPWLLGWGLALALVLVVLGGGAALVTAWVVGDAISGDDPAGEETPRPPKPPPRRRGRR